MKIRAFLTLTATLLLTAPLFGQDRAVIRGTITDPTGALVASAHVELKSPGTGLTRQSVTGGAGIYEFDSLR
jgi:protocatechuate 3,4-dioxygenase beta subunit